MIVYPPQSMDAEELAIDLDDSTLASFMSSYPPVPRHLRKRKDVTEGGDRSDEVEILDGDADVAGLEEEPGEENEDMLEPDPSDDVLLRMQPGQSGTGPLAAGSSHGRRRLMKRGVHVSSTESEVDLSRESALNIPVS